MNRNKIIPFVICFLVVACGSNETKPQASWTQQPTRTVDNGYIVYVEHADGGTLESAQFKAEGLALEDLANECSVIPKGTRIEDRYSEPTEHGVKAAIKLAVEMVECEEASKAIDPEAIRKIANVAFTEQLKRFQDSVESGQIPPASEMTAQVQPPEQVMPMPAQNGWSDQTHFYVVRQYVAYQKEVVVLSPPTAYQPQSPESRNFIVAMKQPTEQIQASYQKDPTLKTNPMVWSHVPNRPEVARPANLQSAAARSTRLREMMARPHQLEHQMQQSRHARRRRVHGQTH